LIKNKPPITIDRLKLSIKTTRLQASCARG
jgi:hypothetical protein